MLKVSAVSYLNSVPFIYGLKQSELIHNIDLQLDYPSICADKLINGNVNIEEGCFIGSGAVINNSITIKKNSFIKAGSIVK